MLEVSEGVSTMHFHQRELHVIPTELVKKYTLLIPTFFHFISSDSQKVMKIRVCLVFH